MKHTQDAIHLLNQSIKSLFKEAMLMSFKTPAIALFMCRTMRQQKKAAKVRQSWEARGVHVPAFMIASITNRCNLQCKGCFAQTQQRFLEMEMSADKLRSVIAEADEMGISIILLSGGEPLARPEILDITRDFPGIIFPLFTNGLLINEEMITRFKKQRNVIPVISLEGGQPCTDNRRGQGVYVHLQKTLTMMHERNIFFGTSLTVTRQNFAVVTNKDFIRELISKGNKLIFFVDYAPVQEGTEDMSLTEAQREEEARLMAVFRSELPGLYFAFPGDEEGLGGCLGAGRGFIHISPGGHVEPCPALPFSDLNLKDVSLKEALQSEFLRTIRDSHLHRSETNGGCALWENREWVASLSSPTN
jgi:MoaA/NifB/PqqE/SkfB family radical SAM enzyme